MTEDCQVTPGCHQSSHQLPVTRHQTTTGKPTFQSHGAMVYDQRILSWKGLDRVSILSLEGRLLVPVVFGAYQAARLDRIRGQIELYSF